MAAPSPVARPKRALADLRLELSGSAAARRDAPPRRQLRLWAQSALGRRARGAELALRIVGTAESRRLNRHYRGKDKPTNVLSFPVPKAFSRSFNGPERLLGDLVVCGAVLRREAREQCKTLRAHWAHLIVHGSLHLAGYDHERHDDARRMERREVAILRQLGFPNPYEQ